MPFPRLRQICLLAPSLESPVADLCRILDLTVAYRDPHLARWGVENAVIAVGPAFIEICAPIHAESAAHRFIARNPDGGGYIVVFNTDDVERERARLHDRSIRIVTDLALDGFRTVQLHPADVGPCMIELNATAGGEGWLGPYFPAGPDWQRHIRTTRVTALAAIEIKTNSPARLAKRWGDLLQAGVTVHSDQTPAIELDGGVIHFNASSPGERDRLSGIVLRAESTTSIEDAMAKADNAGLRNGPHSFSVAGVEIRLVGPSG